MPTYVGENTFQFIGLAVAATWLALAIGGRWRKSDDSIERLGRVVGACWIVIGLIWTIREYFALL